jgi:DNA polymerase-1
LLALVDIDCYLNASAWEKKTIQEAQKRLDEIVEDLVSEVYCTDWVACLGGPENFREELVQEHYKHTETRLKAKSRRPDWFMELKHWIAQKDNVVVSDNEESDDVLAQWQCDDSVNTVIISNDKDFLTVPGKFFSPSVKKYLGRENNFIEQSNEEAFLFFCRQMLEGDSVDNIPGIPGLGPVKSKALLEEISTEEAKALVQGEYELHYGEDWKNYFLINGKLLYLRRKPYQNFTLELFENELN